MKRERELKLFNAVTGISAGEIERGEKCDFQKKAKIRKITRLSAVACALVIAIIAVSVFAPAPGGKPILLPAASAEAIYEAEYPKSVPAPDQEAYVRKDGEVDYDAYFLDYNVWVNANMEKRLESGSAQSMKGYIDATAREILAKGDGQNKVYSPMNVYLALSMLSEITDGDSRGQILSLLGAKNQKALRAQANQVFLSLYANDGETTSIPSASVWLRNDMTYKTDALEILKNDYFASSYKGEMGSDEYNRLLQNWLDEQTGGLLKEQAQKMTMDRETVITLATSLYFKAGWENKFSKSSTLSSVFHAVNGDVTREFMNKSSYDTYYWGENFGAVALSMTGGGRMWFILPDEGVSPETLIEKGLVTDLVMNTGYEMNKSLIINKSIPKFDLTGENDLIQSLKNLGITDVFDESKSDFTPLTEETEMVVSKAQHDVRVKIDEEGVEAAAFTVIMALATSARPPEDEMDFIVDRPFVFAITSQDDLPLFMGVVNHLD